MWYINSSGRIHGSDLTVCKFLQTNPLTGSQLRQVMEWKLNRVQIRAIHKRKLPIITFSQLFLHETAMLASFLHAQNTAHCKDTYFNFKITTKYPISITQF